MLKTQCKYCSKDMILEDGDFEIYDKFSPAINWKKYPIKPQSVCSDCFEQRRLCLRNKRNLYKRKCDFTWKEMISLYSPDKKYKIYNKDVWWSDKWNALDYAMIFDENKWFFDQLDELVHNVPFPNLSIVNSENSEYNDGLVNSKNAYMCFWNNNLEDAYYTEESRLVKDSSDIWWSSEIEKSYECVDCANMYNSRYCSNWSNCSNTIFCKRCNNCHDCFMCYGLEWKKFHILNKGYTEEEYKAKMKDIDLSDYDKLLSYKKMYRDFELTIPHVNLQTYAAENCMWDYVYNSKNAFNCFNVVGVQDCKNLYEWWRCSNVYDSSFIYDLEGPIIGSVNVFMNSKNVYFSEYIYDNSFNIFYSFNLKSCRNCFACVGLVGKEYCIFNRQYKMEDYAVEVERIIKVMMKSPLSPLLRGTEWWEFFPASMSRFGYNETEANEYYPLTEKESKENWFKWSDYIQPLPKVDKIIPANMLPSKAKDIPDDILNRALKCEETGKPYRINKAELKFYRDNKLSIPRFHYDTRYKHRLLSKNQRIIYDRKCDKCSKDIKTTYSHGCPEIVYCEECYNKTIY